MDGIGIWRRKVRDRVWLALALMLAVTPVAAADDDQDKYAPETVAAAERRLSSAGETLRAASACKDDCRFAHVRRGRFCLEVIWHGEWTCLSHAPSPIQP
jgi:hypothetical protein